MLRSSLPGLALLAMGLVNAAPDKAPARAPQGQNCALKAPPPDAGEDINHGQVLRIYPRAKQIGPGYSGCQLLFAPQPEGRWSLVLATELQGGDPVRVWSSDTSDPSWTSCRYSKGRLVRGDPDQCPAPQLLLRRSLPPGCAERLLKSNGSEWPADCELE